MAENTHNKDQPLTSRPEFRHATGRKELCSRKDGSLFVLRVGHCLHLCTALRKDGVFPLCRACASLISDVASRRSPCKKSTLRHFFHSDSGFPSSRGSPAMMPFWNFWNRLVVFARISRLGAMSLLWTHFQVYSWIKALKNRSFLYVFCSLDSGGHISTCNELLFVIWFALGEHAYSGLCCLLSWAATCQINSVRWHPASRLGQRRCVLVVNVSLNFPRGGGSLAILNQLMNFMYFWLVCFLLN